MTLNWRSPIIWICTLLCLLLGGISTAWAVVNCVPLKKDMGGNLTFFVLKSGTDYCLAENAYATKRSAIAWEGGGGQANIVTLAGNNITLDLQEHSLSGGDIRTAGVVSAIVNNVPEVSGKGFHVTPPTTGRIYFNNITIRNGVIDVRGIGILIGGLGVDHAPISTVTDILEVWKINSGQEQDSTASALAKSSYADLKNTLPATPGAYPKRNTLIENMRIHNKNIGIVVQGADTVIRNSTIEVDAGTAIWIYGPNAIIENNTIIVHGNYELRTADAAIRLHHGDGAIIRNNRIIVKGKAHRRAITAVDTGAFIVSDNTFYGIDKKDKLIEAIPSTARPSVSGANFEPLWKTWF